MSLHSTVRTGTAAERRCVETTTVALLCVGFRNDDAGASLGPDKARFATGRGPRPGCPASEDNRVGAVSLHSAAAPYYARPFVALFLATLVVCALGAWNAWPFPAWELFSHLRTDRQTGWAAVAVDSAGRERNYPVVSLQHGYRGFGFIMAGFSKRSSADRDAICAAWLRGATEQFGSGTRLLRIYHLEWLLSDRQGKRAAPPHRALAWFCTAKGAREAG